MTATATKCDREAIKRSLDMKNCSEVVGNPDVDSLMSTLIGMFGMRNFRYRYTGKIIPILSVYWLSEQKKS